MSGEDERVLQELMARGDRAARAPGAAPDLVKLRAALDDAPDPSPALVETTLRRARAELAASQPSAYVGALARLAGVVSIPLALAVLWNAAIWMWGPALLSPWLPELVARGLPAAYVFGATGWLALICAALPALAHHQLVLRHREALS